MLDLVGNPGDRFSHNEAHISSSHGDQDLGAMARKFAVLENNFVSGCISDQKGVFSKRA